MHMLSRKAKYAITALTRLARTESREPALIADIAEAENIPRKFLEAILLELRNAGILGSKKGKGGGYHLAKPASEITVGAVIRVLDGPLAPVRCASQSAPEMCEECKDPATCALRLTMIDVRKAMADVLDHVSLIDLIKRERDAQENRVESMYYI